MPDSDDQPADQGQARISVVVPVHNGEKYLRATLESIVAQTFRPLEVLVIDDASDDGSREIADSFGGPVRCIRLQRSGAACARNKGVVEAQGEFLSFLDADDLWLASKLQVQLDVIRGRPNSAVFCHMEQFISPEIDGLTIADKDKVLPGFSSCTMLIRTADFRTVGYFQEDIRAGEFIEWFARAKDSGVDHIMLNDILAKRRIHKSNQGLSNNGRQDYLRIAKMLIDRNRSRQQNRSGGTS